MVEGKCEDGIAIINDNDEVITYSQLADYIKDFYEHIEPRQIVLIMTKNNFASIIGYLSCMKNKSIPFLVRDSAKSEVIEKYIEDYDIKYVWISDELFVDNVPNLKYKEGKVFERFGYSLVTTGKELCKVNEELALLLTTSGSTGSSKCVRISYKNIESNTKNISEYLNISERDKAITSLPMNYTYGLSVINTHLYKRATLLLTDKAPYEKVFWDFFKKYEGTAFAGVPYTYEILKKMGFAKKNVSTLQILTVAGGKLGLEEEKYFIDYSIKNNKKFYVMYGQTEATARISYRPLEVMDKKLGSIGKAIPNGKMWIENSDGIHITESNKTGEIVYCGDNVAMGYAYGKQDLEKGYEWGNILYTKDIGYIDEDGYFYVCGRKDRMVKINGIRVELDELEKDLRKKFNGKDFYCETEKCMDSVCFTRIKIMCKAINTLATYEREELIRFISERTGLSKRYFRIS